MSAFLKEAPPPILAYLVYIENRFCQMKRIYSRFAMENCACSLNSTMNYLQMDIWCECIGIYITKKAETIYRIHGFAESV